LWTDDLFATIASRRQPIHKASHTHTTMSTSIDERPHREAPSSDGWSRFVEALQRYKTIQHMPAVIAAIVMIAAIYRLYIRPDRPTTGIILADSAILLGLMTIQLAIYNKAKNLDNCAKDLPIARRIIALTGPMRTLADYRYHSLLGQLDSMIKGTFTQHVTTPQEDLLKTFSTIVHSAKGRFDAVTIPTFWIRHNMGGDALDEYVRANVACALQPTEFNRYLIMPATYSSIDDLDLEVWENVRRAVYKFVEAEELVAAHRQSKACLRLFVIPITHIPKWDDPLLNFGTWTDIDRKEWHVVMKHDHSPSDQVFKEISLVEGVDPILNGHLAVLKGIPLLDSYRPKRDSFKTRRIDRVPIVHRPSATLIDGSRTYRVELRNIDDLARPTGLGLSLVDMHPAAVPGVSSGPDGVASGPTRGSIVMLRDIGPGLLRQPGIGAIPETFNVRWSHALPDGTWGMGLQAPTSR
jgi:hypothetical protein